jgi:ribosome-associated toxin RatA of RatAB toxin-antitoxin module
MQQQSYTTTVAASPQACFTVITDFDSYTRWSSAIRAATVRERHPDGMPKQVEMQLDMKIRTIRYVLEYQHEPPTRLTWSLVDGDIKAVEGSYLFEEVAPGRTQMTCTQGVDIGFWVPGFLKSLFESQALKDSVDELKREVEARQQAG